MEIRNLTIFPFGPWYLAQQVRGLFQREERMMPYTRAGKIDSTAVKILSAVEESFEKK
jgi:hypothetical protein